MIDENTFIKEVDFTGVKGVIFINTKILVYRRDNKTSNFPLMVDLPGGGREKNETPYDTFKREIYEEFGLILKKSDIIFSKKYKSILNPKEDVYFIVVKSLDLKEEDIIFGDEGTEFMIMDPKIFITLNDGIKIHQERVAKYLNTL